MFSPQRVQHRIIGQNRALLIPVGVPFQIQCFRLVLKDSKQIRIKNPLLFKARLKKLYILSIAYLSACIIWHVLSIQRILIRRHRKKKLCPASFYIPLQQRQIMQNIISAPLR